VSERPAQVAVIGGGRAEPGLLELAEEVGRRLAEAGAVLVCGGRGGVMEAASRGAHGAGGVVIGILPGLSPADANEFVTHTVATGVGHARNLAVVASGDAVIAIGGEWGTLSEIALARRLGHPVIALRSWTLQNDGVSELGIDEADGAEQAVERALEAARGAAPQPQRGRDPVD
jgi:uncharacterized protein (TIGR00725 family)